MDIRLLIEECRLKELETYLEENPQSINAENLGQTPLSIACWNGHLAVVSLLINLRADMNRPDNNGQTPLWVSCCNNHLAVVSLLLNMNADVNTADIYGKTALWISCARGHSHAVSLLLTRGAHVLKADDFGKTPLWIACHSGHMPIVTLLLKQPAVLESINQCNMYGETAIWTACYYNHREIVKLLLQNNASVSIANKDEDLPVHIACFHNHVDLAVMLVENDADISIKNSIGKVPLDYISDEEDRNMIYKCATWGKSNPVFSWMCGYSIYSYYFGVPNVKYETMSQQEEQYGRSKGLIPSGASDCLSSFCLGSHDGENDLVDFDGYPKTMEPHRAAEAHDTDAVDDNMNPSQKEGSNKGLQTPSVNASDLPVYTPSTPSSSIHNFTPFSVHPSPVPVYSTLHSPSANNNFTPTPPRNMYNFHESQPSPVLTSTPDALAAPATNPDILSMLGVTEGSVNEAEEAWEKKANNAAQEQKDEQNFEEMVSVDVNICEMSNFDGDTSAAPVAADTTETVESVVNLVVANREASATATTDVSSGAVEVDAAPYVPAENIDTISPKQSPHGSSKGNSSDGSGNKQSQQGKNGNSSSQGQQKGHNSKQQKKKNNNKR